MAAASELMYSPFSKAIFDDPYPVYRQVARRSTGLSRLEERWWVLSRLSVAGALRDWETYSSNPFPRRSTGRRRPKVLGHLDGSAFATTGFAAC